jgi:DNA modification methylase
LIVANLAPQKIETVPIGTLKHHPKNPRKGDVKSITESIEHNGFYGVVVAQKSTGYVLAGNHRMMAAKAAGLDSLPVAYVDVDDATALKILLADNRTNDLATYDNKELAELLADVSNTIGLDGTGFDEAFLDGLIGELAQETPAGNADDVPEAQISKADELREKWQTELGQLWEVGRHRILCGDSTDEKQVARLMDGKKADMVWTDPPYGVAYVGKTKDNLTIENDELDEVQLEKFLNDSLGIACAFTKPGGAFYVAASPGPLHLAFAKVLHGLGVWRQTLQWVKSSMVLGRSDYHYKNEPIFYGWKPGASHVWNSDRTQTTVLEFNKPHRNELHPTMKPVELVQYCIQNSSIDGEIVYDCFSGSGSTILACQIANRVGYGMELDPAYVAVILERLSEMGLEPRLID